MTGTEPQWLEWAREIQATAQTGLTFTRDPYDRERYEALRDLAARIMAAGSDTPPERIAGLFAGETGYATPKLDVRGAVFDAEDRLLLVRETALPTTIPQPLSARGRSHNRLPKRRAVWSARTISAPAPNAIRICSQ